MDENTLVILGYVIFAIGIVGLIFPLLPGGPVIFIGAGMVAWCSHYQSLSLTGLIIIGVLGALSLLVDFFASLLGAKRVGASSAAIWGAAIGGFIGLAGGIVGIIVGPFIGGFVGELYSTQDVVKAGKVGIGTWVGIALGAICKIVLGIIMILVLVLS